MANQAAEFTAKPGPLCDKNSNIQGKKFLAASAPGGHRPLALKMRAQCFDAGASRQAINKGVRTALGFAILALIALYSFVAWKSKLWIPQARQFASAAVKMGFGESLAKKERKLLQNELANAPIAQASRSAKGTRRL